MMEIAAISLAVGFLVGALSGLVIACMLDESSPKDNR